MADPFRPLAGQIGHLNSIESAAHVAKTEFARRDISPEIFDSITYGQTVIQPGSYYAAVRFSALIGAENLPAPLINQACATGPRLLANALGDMSLGMGATALIASGDRTSNGAHVYYPAPEGSGGTGVSENWVMDSFMHDPWAKGAMVTTAENVAKRFGIETAEQHELVIQRNSQYQDALANDRAFQKRYMPAELEVPDARFRKVIGTMSRDEGVEPVSAEKMASLRPVVPGGTVTFAGQTHPADGNAAMVVTASAERAVEISGAAQPVIEILAFGTAREEKGYMPAAPIKAAASALATAGMVISDVDAIKSHNPFAVNDIAFARAFEIDWSGMNNFGSSLIWGHPQGPTGLRGMIELIEELALRGGGVGLF